MEIDSFVTHRATEHGMFQKETPGDGVVCGHGTIQGRHVHVFAQDFSVHGGAIGEAHGMKIAKIVEMAERSRTPLIGFWDGGGQRANDGMPALAGSGVMLDRLVQCSGQIPMIAVVLGPAVGVSALAAGLADVAILGEKLGQLFMSSPLETPEVIEQDLDASKVGGLRCTLVAQASLTWSPLPWMRQSTWSFQYLSIFLTIVRQCLLIR